MLHSNAYPYLRADGVPVAHPLFQADGGGSIPTSALQLHFEESPVDEALSLNALWHSVLPGITRSTVVGCGPYHACYVAEYEGGFYATAIWSNPVALNRMSWSPDEVIELRRFAIAPQAPRNTASRMLSYMTKHLRRKFPLLTTLISYQDLGMHKGTIYKAAGWTPNANLSTYQPWDQPDAGRHREASVTTSDKVRWELVLT